MTVCGSAISVWYLSLTGIALIFNYVLAQVLHLLTSTRHYYISINATTFELSVFWPYDTESRINK